MDSDSFAAWETQHHNANLDGFKLPILRVTWQIQNQRQEMFCVSSEATLLFQLGGPVRNRLLHLTVALKQKSVISLDAGLRPDGILALGFWDVLEPQAQGNLTQHPQEKQQMSKNNEREATNRGSRLCCPECTHI